MATIYALTSTQGTAISETAICGGHWKKDFDHIRSNAQFIDDWDRLDFQDCSGNEVLECQICGATGQDDE